MNWQRWPMAVLAGSTAALALLTVLVALRATVDFDLATTRLFQSVASPTLDLAANYHTITGQAITTVAVALVLSLYVWRRYGGLAWMAPLFIVLTAAIELVLKFGLVHPGPPDEFIRAFFNPGGIRVHTPSAFPSGHTARIAFLAVTMFALFPHLIVRSALVAFVLFSVFARVYIGDHWISDVLGGLALGLGVGAAAVLWMQRAKS